MKRWESEKHKKVGTSPQKGFKDMLLRTENLLELQESVVLVVGQWCNWITMENWDLCIGCMAQWMQNLSKGAELTAFCLL